MGLYKQLPETLTEVDVIVVGGGTAGCAVAGRVAAADPNISVLVIEGGPDNANDPTVIFPALFLAHLTPESKTTIFYTANKSKHLADRASIIPAGGILGGGSSINFMMYTRTQRSDYDSWNTPGWSTEELLPFMNKLETYHGPGAPEIHGHDGPVAISSGTWRTKRVEDDWMQAAEQVGFPEKNDLQCLDENNGFQRWLRYVGPDGRRSDSAHAYIHPLLQDGKHPNLHVLVEAKVIRVLFDENKKAVGVEFTPNPDYQPAPEDTEPPKFQVKTRKTVVLSAGGCGTPLLLERSGIGSTDVLKKAGVDVVEDLPGVGADYQDHLLMLWPYKTGLDPTETLDGIITGRLSVEEAMTASSPLLGWNSCDIAGKLRPSDEDIAALGPEFKKAWERDFQDKPDRPLMLMALVQGYSLDPIDGVEPGQYVSVAPFTAYSYSSGHIHITGPNWNDPLDFDVGFFNDEHELDIKKHVWAYKKSREIMRRTAMFRGEVPTGHPRYPEGSKAAVQETWTEGQHQDVADIEYSPEDDEAIVQKLRETVNTTWHGLATARMAPREDKGVVDANLNVYGVQGLKAADLSICPVNIGSNTNNTAFVIGEKCADIIIHELGLKTEPVT
ncbi:GMC oxidoreductase [Xylariales sp. PMI_506]|nr:GMC oxidoreductase [Xylariales sp. PMI_506]